jgi:hypothetical protein
VQIEENGDTYVAGHNKEHQSQRFSDVFIIFSVNF